MQPLKNYLMDAILRARIGRQVLSSQVVETAREALLTVIPESAEMTRVVSFKNDTLVIECVNSSVANEISSRVKPIASRIESIIPNVSIKKISTRMVHSIEYDI